MSEQMRVVATDPEVVVVGQVIQRAYYGDAGWDLFVQPGKPGDKGWEETRGGSLTASHWLIEPGRFLDLPLGVRVELPDRHWGMLTGRSSTLRTRGLLIHTAIIDNGYRGPLFAGVWNLTDELVAVPAGAKIAQLIPIPIWDGAAVLVDELTDSHRGSAGFGSSGT